MSGKPEVFIYGASGYTGKLVAESLVDRSIPFCFAGRNRQRLEEGLAIVEERCGRKFDAEIAVCSNTTEEMVPALEGAKVLINVAGPFMQIAPPIVEAALRAGCHYIDTTGEQDFTKWVKDEYGARFAEKGLLVAPATSYMWAAGALAAEVCLEEDGLDTLELVYQIDRGLPSEASTKSFLRMVCNDVSQYYLDLNELKAWPNDQVHTVVVPGRATTLRAHPWGGACEPIWYMDDDRIASCAVLTAIGEHMIDPVIQAIKHFNEASKGMTQDEREALTNAMGDQMATGEPPKDHPDVQRSIIVCNARGRQKVREFVMNMSAPYTWTGDVCAESAQRLLNGQLKEAGFQSAARAFGHRELLKEFEKRGFCNYPFED